MPPRALVPSARSARADRSLARYGVLRDRVRETILTGQRKVEEAKVLTYWNTGRYIREHIRLNADTAAYARKVLKKLGRDTGLDASVLRKTVRFYDVFSSGAARPTFRPRLSWTHYRALLTVDDEKRRTALERRAYESEWSTDELIERIGRSSSSPAGRLKAADAKSLLTSLKGKTGIYRLAESGGGLHWDLGFASYRELTEKEARRFKAGGLVRLKKKGSGRLERAPEARPKDLYTYEAELIKVIDADTFWFKIYTARPAWRKEKLRLRAIDAPELSTAAGRTAKRFVERLFKEAGWITVTTTKPDKYHRYLSDVFLHLPAGVTENALSSAGRTDTDALLPGVRDAEGDVFLNNFLLATGNARLMKDIPVAEWEKE